MRTRGSKSVGLVHDADKKAFIQDWSIGTLHSQGALAVVDSRPLFRLYEACAGFYRALCRKEGHLKHEFSVQLMQTEFVRLQLWADDVIIGDLDDTLQNFNGLLRGVNTSLVQIARSLLRGSRDDGSNRSSLQQELAANIKIFCKYQDLEPGKEETVEYDGGSGDESEDDLADDVQFHTDCLLQLSPTIKKCLSQSNRKSAPNTPFAVSTPASYYVRTVCDKFPNADMGLVERLGEANWQRHIRLRAIGNIYNDSHDNPGSGYCDKDNKVALAQTVFGKANVPEPQSIFHDSGVGTMESAGTTYAPSLKSHSSFVSSNAEVDRGSLRVPSTPPQVILGEPFVCEFCNETQYKILNRVDWKRHFFSDLKPYLCTYQDCPDFLSQFSTRDQWAEHEFMEHRLYERWNCVECTEELDSASDWRGHLKSIHSVDLLSDSQCYMMHPKAVHKSPGAIERELCLLCRTCPAKSRRDFIKHVCRHMEEVALMALPINEFDDDNRSESSGATKPHQSPLSSNGIKPPGGQDNTPDHASTSDIEPMGDEEAGAPSDMTARSTSTPLADVLKPPAAYELDDIPKINFSPTREITLMQVGDTRPLSGSVRNKQITPETPRDSHDLVSTGSDVGLQHKAANSAKGPLLHPIHVSNSGAYACSHCRSGSAQFGSVVTMLKHIQTRHIRPFSCLFRRYGCPQTFGSKNEWARHIRVQHLRVEVWRCDLGRCGAELSEDDRGGHIFDRKDLFIQHLRRIHKEFDAGTERLHMEVGRCHVVLRQTPTKIMCPYCPPHELPPRANTSTRSDTLGASAVLGVQIETWEAFLEHVARHLEAGAGTDHGDGREDPLLRRWLLEEGLLQPLISAAESYEIVGCGGKKSVATTPTTATDLTNRKRSTRKNMRSRKEVVPAPTQTQPRDPVDSRLCRPSGEDESSVNEPMAPNNSDIRLPGSRKE